MELTREDYGRNLEENLDRLVERLKRKSCKPQPARRVEIPRENGKTRPLSIYCYEDKLVQDAPRRILEAVFEPHFYDGMTGFRPGRSCHMALRKLNDMIEHHPANYVSDADIRGFFDHIDHEWAVRFIEAKIKDPNITKLVSMAEGIVGRGREKGQRGSNEPCRPWNAGRKYCGYSENEYSCGEAVA